MRGVFRKSGTATILAILAIVAGVALSGCGQRGSLYMPTVPPLPAKPVQTQPASSDATKSDDAQGSIPDTSGTPLSLSPDSELRTAPNSNMPAQPASGASQAE
ncbi:lipoprotein [Paraburkholderia phymatum]|uniref:Putative lipoprotein n=1 Tax=Paraburkholderia phymatum (strain DSM 17167 / CIP 108236 / LMG 21445 / STM815) TaxID=391038 RepID=B2JI27_PARP8|nr:lipoprotein [Paraburkholderia phymatum]ACC71973.1 putative lipoprotein [Paraburkholderia phymatum STM815]